jgi:hypothetical protein
MSGRGKVVAGLYLIAIAGCATPDRQNPRDIIITEVTVRIAQLVERWSNKPLVLGSIPNVNTLFFFLFFCSFFLFFVLEGRHTVYIKKNAFGTFVGVCNGAL